MITTTTTMVPRDWRTENRETAMARRADGDDDDDDDDDREEASRQLLKQQNLPLLFLELHSQNCRGPSRAKTKIPPI